MTGSFEDGINKLVYLIGYLVVFWVIRISHFYPDEMLCPTKHTDLVDMNLAVITLKMFLDGHLERVQMFISSSSNLLQLQNQSYGFFESLANHM